MAPHRGRVLNFGDLSAGGHTGGAPAGSDAYGSMVTVVNFQRGLPSGLTHRVSSGSAVNAARMSAMSLSAGLLDGH